MPKVQIAFQTPKSAIEKQTKSVTIVPHLGRLILLFWVEQYLCTGLVQDSMALTRPLRN